MSCKNDVVEVMDYPINLSHWQQYDESRLLKAALIELSSLNFRVKELEKTLKYVSQYLRDIEAI